MLWNPTFRHPLLLDSPTCFNMWNDTDSTAAINNLKGSRKRISHITKRGFNYVIMSVLAVFIMVMITKRIVKCLLVCIRARGALVNM